MLSALSQAQIDNYSRYLEVPRIVKFVDTESRMVIVKGWGEKWGIV